MLSEGIVVGQALRLPRQPMRLLYKKRRQKMLNRRINSWRASIACAGFIRLSTFSRRSRSIAASSRTNWLRAFHFAYLPAPMPSASSAEITQTVMSVVVTRSITSENRSPNVSPFTTKFKRHSGSLDAPSPFLGVRLEKLPKVSREARDTAGRGHPRSQAIQSCTRKLTFLRRGGHFRHASPHRKPLRCIHGYLVRRCALDSGSGGDCGESSGSIPDWRDDSNSQAEKEEKRTEFSNCSNRDQARRCSCTGPAGGGCRRITNTTRPGEKEKDRAQPEYCLSAAKSKSGDSRRTTNFCGRADCNCRACRKETSTEKTAATRCAT